MLKPLSLRDGMIIPASTFCRELRACLYAYRVLSSADRVQWPEGVNVDFGLISALLDAFGLSITLISEANSRKKGRRTDALTRKLQAFDPDEIVELLGDVEAASYMRGALTADIAGAAIGNSETKALVQELIVAAFAGDIPTDRDAILAAFSDYLTSAIDSSVSREDARFFADAVSRTLGAKVEVLVDALRQADPDRFTALQQGGMAKRAAAIASRTEKHLEALAASLNPDVGEAARKWLNSYRTQCEAAHGYIQPPDFETNRKIPMRDLYVVPKLKLGKHPADSEFSEFVESIDRTVLLGNPGGGKSTLSNYLTALWANSSSELVPFHVTLRDFAKQAEHVSVLQYIENNLAPRYQTPAPDGSVEHLLLSGAAVVVFDGLDELIDTTKRRLITDTAVRSRASRTS